MTAARAPEAKIDPREAGERMVRLVEERGYLGAILGSDPATVERFKTVLLSALTGSPKLLQADPATLVQAMREAAMWDLEPDGIDAVIVPYWNSKRSVYEADFQVTARGYVTVLYRSPRVLFVDADVIYDADEFTFEKGAVPRLVHRPKMFGDRGNRIGAYALVQLNTGFVRPIVLNEEQIQKRRKVARDSEKGPWLDWEDEMWRKTALRALMSLVPIERGVKAALAVEATKYPELATPEPMLSLPEPPASVPTSLLAARAAFVGEPEPELEWAPGVTGPASARPAHQPPEATEPAPEPPSEPETVVVVSEVAICNHRAQDGLMLGAVCMMESDHKGAHRSEDGSWPR